MEWDLGTKKGFRDACIFSALLVHLVLYVLSNPFISTDRLNIFNRLNVRIVTLDKMANKHFPLKGQHFEKIYMPEPIPKSDSKITTFEDLEKCEVTVYRDQLSRYKMLLLPVIKPFCELIDTFDKDPEKYESRKELKDFNTGNSIWKILSNDPNVNDKQMMVTGYVRLQLVAVIEMIMEQMNEMIMEQMNLFEGYEDSSEE